MAEIESVSRRFRLVNVTFKFDAGGRVASLSEMYDAVGELPGVVLELTWLGPPEAEPAGPKQASPQLTETPRPQEPWPAAVRPKLPRAVEFEPPPAGKPQYWQQRITRRNSNLNVLDELFRAHPGEIITLDQLRAVYPDMQVANTCSAMARRGYLERVGPGEYMVHPEWLAKWTGA